MELKEIQTLIDKYLSGTASQTEKDAVERWYDRIDGANGDFSDEKLTEIKKEMHSAIFEQLPGQRKIRRLYQSIRWIAAVLVVGCGVGLFYFNAQPPVTDKLAGQPRNDVQPGGNKAILTLADGSTVSLGGSGKGMITRQGGAIIRKNGEGLITYSESANDLVKEATYNIISTPRGGKYAIILADGTKVWLNAASSLKYPTTFEGSKREVEISGEAYFEVAKITSMPFRVLSKAQVIEVMGTHFNINAYPDEQQTISTLLEGIIKVSNGNSTAILAPGQQAVIHNLQPGIKTNSEVNTGETVAWKHDLFHFEDADIKTIMNQIGRWYDVEVVYQGEIPRDHYRGKVSRNSNLSNALRILEASGINFKIEGRKIIVK